MHNADLPFGEALLTLRTSGKYSEEAIDRRVNATATATSQGELIMHLRGLVTRLRSLRPSQPLNYSQLVEDIYDWNTADGQQRVRRRWGAQYYGWARRDRDSATSDT
jgi:CRISPR system Cascade subunit CasB